MLTLATVNAELRNDEMNNPDWDWPRKRDKATGVKVKLEKVNASAWFAEEATVTFVLGDKRYHGWMPNYSVNIPDKWLKAFIVGDYANGDWEILIPNETMSSADFLRVPLKDQDIVVKMGWW